MFDISDNEGELIGEIAGVVLSFICPPALAAIYIMCAVKAGRKIKEERAKEKAAISRCETKNGGSNTIGFVYNGEVR